MSSACDGLSAPSPDLLHTPVGVAAVLGAIDVESTERGIRWHRLPERSRRRIPTEFLRAVEAQPTGVRIAFETAARRIALRLRATALVLLPTATADSWGALDIVVDGTRFATLPIDGGSVKRLDLAADRATIQDGPDAVLELPELAPGRKQVELWLPYSVEVELLELTADAPIAPLREPAARWVHYGSSISHGFNAAHPLGTWPAIAARRAGVELRNLGFAGNAVLDQFVARAIRDTPAELITLKVGINVVNFDGFRARTFVAAVDGFLDTIRDGHPDTPIALVSPLHCPSVEDRPGPTIAFGPSGAIPMTTNGRPEDLERGRLGLGVIRSLLAGLVERRRAEDPRLASVDGLRLFGETDAAEHPLLDGAHPEPAAHELIGQRFADDVLGPLLAVAGMRAR